MCRVCVPSLASKSNLWWFMFIRANAVDDEKGYAMWALKHRYCHACGVPFYKASRERWPGLTTHHMVKCHRSDEPCNLLRLCGYCHPLAENQDIKHRGELLPHIGLAIALTIKKRTDPWSWNPERLEELYHRPLPEMAQIPLWFEQEWLVWQGRKFRGE